MPAAAHSTRFSMRKAKLVFQLKFFLQIYFISCSFNYSFFPVIVSFIPIGVPKNRNQGPSQNCLLNLRMLVIIIINDYITKY